mmetsp:Transcript_21695/g.51243  ORF Transcript_21695/g.51243 Transcript_21695/m.51243 type:complete len:205 (-) Transcript_21695:2373-2987(-)
MAPDLTNAETMLARWSLARGASMAISLRNSNGSLRPFERDSPSIFFSSMRREKIASAFSTSSFFISSTRRTALSTVFAPRSTDPSFPATMSSSNDRMASSASPPTKYSLRIFLDLSPHSSGVLKAVASGDDGAASVAGPFSFLPEDVFCCWPGPGVSTRGAKDDPEGTFFIATLFLTFLGLCVTLPREDERCMLPKDVLRPKPC